MTAPSARSSWQRGLGVVAVVGLVVGCTPASSAVPSAASQVGATPSPSSAAPDLSLELVADGLSTPVGLVPVPGDDDQALVLEQTGQVWVLDGDQLLPDPLLDLSDRVVDLDPSYDERGLLGLVFHPDFASNGRLFVYYSAPLRDAAPSGQDHTNRLSEFTFNRGELRADPASERVILEFEQPQPNHSGGALGFGPDGYLYLGAGDGGGTGDDDEGHSPQGNAQDTTRLNAADQPGRQVARE